MKFVFFCHSLISDWNNGNAHFLRGIASDLLARGHESLAYEPSDGWSIHNLLQEYGPEPIARFAQAYPQLKSIRYTLPFDPALALAGADVVIVHEWNEPDLVARVGAHHAEHGGYRLFFHDTHHRGVSKPEEMGRYDLRGYDGVLAFGEVLRRVYLQRGWHARAWTWHEAADARVFYSRGEEQRRDLVWVGNWGDEERSAELHEFLIEPCRRLALNSTVYGVRYPEAAQAALARAGIEYGGWLANFDVPEVFSRHRVTLHVPRRPYTQVLRGIPTIRVFEALACGIPLVSAPWYDYERLFTPGEDFLVARNGSEMQEHLCRLLDDTRLADDLAEHGRQTVLAHHTCTHRVDQLLQIIDEVQPLAPKRRREALTH